MRTLLAQCHTVKVKEIEDSKKGRPQDTTPQQTASSLHVAMEPPVLVGRSWVTLAPTPWVLMEPAAV